MKKILNDPRKAAEEAMEGIVLSQHHIRENTWEENRHQKILSCGWKGCSHMRRRKWT